MRRHELSDEEWAIIAPLLPNKPRGVSFDLGRMPYLVCGKAERSQRHRSVSAALGYRSFLPKIPSWSVRKPCLRHQLTRPVPTGRSQPPGENGTAERERRHVFGTMAVNSLAPETAQVVGILAEFPAQTL